MYGQITKMKIKEKYYVHSDEIENPFSEELDDSLPNSNSQGRCVMLYAFGGIDIKRGILILIISASS